MNFNDIFKSSFLENVSTVSILDMALALVLAFCLGLFIFMVYIHNITTTRKDNNYVKHTTNNR